MKYVNYQQYVGDLNNRKKNADLVIRSDYFYIGLFRRELSLINWIVLWFNSIRWLPKELNHNRSRR